MAALQRCLGRLGLTGKKQCPGRVRQSAGGGAPTMSTHEAKKALKEEAQEKRVWAEWVERTEREIAREAGERGGEGGGGEGWTPHPPVHPVPDNDWVGETWGLYFQDMDFEELQEEVGPYISKYYPDPHDPAEEEAELKDAPSLLLCPLPRPRTPTPPPPPPPPPKPVEKPKPKSPSPPPLSVKVSKCHFCDFTSAQKNMMEHMKGSHRAFL